MEAAAAFAQRTFDYIVVGGGTTGLALASLLSADPDVQVGVIEAGLRKDDDTILIPGLYGTRLQNPEYDWAFLSTPQPLADGRRLLINRGKALGGTSALNHMVYTRGSKIEFDDWEKLGITGWNWNAIRDAVNASEAWTPPSEYARLHHANEDAANHGRHGYIKTTAFSYYYDLVQPFFQTMNKLGVRTNRSEASGDLIGIWTYTASVDPQTNTRSYSTNAYYDRVSAQPNIVCLTGASVSRVVMSDSKGGVSRASGVEFYSAGQLFSASVRREVILSAGAFQTPQILELSGIGNPDILSALGVPLKIDLPGVGENLQDHFTVPLGAELLSHHITGDDLSSAAFAQARLEEYRATRRGIMSSLLSTLVFVPASTFVGAAQMTAMLAALDAALATPAIQDSPYKAWYDLQRAWLAHDGVAQLEIVLFPYYTHAGCARTDAKHYSMQVFLEHAWSRGRVHVTSASTADAPAIDLAVLDAPGDVDMTLLVAAVRYALRIMQTGALGELTGAIVAPLPTWTEAELRAYVRGTVQSALHPIGTASMLPRSAQGVVDSELKVYGTENLRVADASVFPIHLATHPQATLYGHVSFLPLSAVSSRNGSHTPDRLAHRAADLITSERKGTQAHV